MTKLEDLLDGCVTARSDVLSSGAAAVHLHTVQQGLSHPCRRTRRRAHGVPEGSKRSHPSSANAPWLAWVRLRRGGPSQGSGSSTVVPTDRDRATSHEAHQPNTCEIGGSMTGIR